MAIYYMTYAMLCLIAIIAQYGSKDLQKRSGAICIFGFIFIFLILALRHWSMGVDLGYYTRNYVGYGGGYIPSFERLNQYSWLDIIKMKDFLNYEKGYIIFNKLVGSIHNDKQFLLGVCAFINASVTAVFIYKNSKLPFLSWIVLLGLPVFLMFFSGLRQDLAISITMMSVYWIKKKKIIPFILTVLLASTMHSSAIVFLVAYPMYYVKLTEMQSFIFTLLIPVVYVLKAPLFTVLSKILKENAEMENTGAGTLFVVFFMVYLFLVVSNSQQHKKQSGWINLFYIACICQAFGGIYSTAMRVGYYFMPYLAAALPNTVSDFQYTGKNTEKRDFILSYVFILIAFALFGLYSLSSGSWAKTNPYVFFWQTP